MSGEIRSIDRRRSRLEIREGFSHSRTIRFDERTRVLDGRRRYSIYALDRGDRVRIWVTYDRRGTPWVDRIELRSSSHGYLGAPARVERFGGHIGEFGPRRSYFTIELNRYDTIVVYLPERLSGSDTRYIQRLRRRDHIWIDALPLGRGRVEFVRFR